MISHRTIMEAEICFIQKFIGTERERRNLGRLENVLFFVRLSALCGEKQVVGSYYFVPDISNEEIRWMW